MVFTTRNPTSPTTTTTARTNGSEKFEEFLTRRHFAGLDGLRALSIVAVLWHHSAGAGFDTDGPLGVLTRGFFGVDLFFAISGFLITALLLRERRTTGGINLRNFYVRRTLRIFPLYYLVLGAYLVLTLAMERDTPKGQQFLESLPAFVTYTSNWFVNLHDPDGVTFYFAWSLAAEEQFYLTWPPVLVGLWWLTRRLRGAGTGTDWPAALGLVGLGAVALIAAEQVKSTPDPSLALRIAASPQIAMISGALLALIVHRRRGYALLAPVLARRWSAPVLLAAVGAALVWYPKIPVVGVVMAPAVAAVCLRPSGPAQWTLSLPLLVSVGTVSYGMYLMHMLVLNLVERVSGLERGPLLFVLLVPATYLVALVVYRYVESQILALKHRFSSEPAQR